VDQEDISNGSKVSRCIKLTRWVLLAILEGFLGQGWI